jgi:ribosome-associated translation inhibitor RaiA
MDIVLHAHHAEVPETVRAAAEAALRRIGERRRRLVNALVRFVADGPQRRVEIVLHGARQRALVATADSAAFEPALAVALERMEAQLAHARRPRRGLDRGRTAR